TCSLTCSSTPSTALMNSVRLRMSFAQTLVSAYLACLLGASASAQTPTDLRVGHWVRAKGTLDVGGVFQAEKVEVLEPTSEQALIGEAQFLSDGRLLMLDQIVHLSAKTNGLHKVDLGNLSGRFKVTGYYRGVNKFSARAIVPYRSKLDQIEARIDSIDERDGRLALSLLKYEVILPLSGGVKSGTALDEVELAPLQEFGEGVRDRDDDDYIGASRQLSQYLRVGARLTLKSQFEDDHDLDRTVARDRLDSEASLRLEAIYQPPGNFYGLLGWRQVNEWRDDQEDGYSDSGSGKLAEVYGYWRGVGCQGVDVQVGRQDFDERREWLYDQNLDGARLIYKRGEVRAEFSATTILSGGNAREENTDNLMVYGTYGPPDRQLGAYMIGRRDPRGTGDYPYHYGLRALGEWLPDNKIWAEVSARTGYRGFEDLRGYATDFGTSWFPPFAEDYYFTAGYALGSGDSDPTDGVDQSFRQTGLQDNNDKFGGVTSFRYYGELLDPELSNLGVLTLGVGRRFGKRDSLDLVFHSYVQDQAADYLTNTDLKRKPDGIHTQLGWELDIIYGKRVFADADLEVIGGMFSPGDAFADRDTAYLAKVQLRIRL
ncbi:MAG: alginate export family protein, partial [bacterium]